MKLTELIEKGISKRLDSIYTAIPAIVTKIDLSTMKCDIQPKMKLKNPANNTFEELPIIQDVPIAYPKTADSVLLMPPEVGDVVLVLFSKYALETLLKDKNTADVNDIRRFSINDAIIIAGLFTSVDSIPNMNEGEIMLYHKSGAYIKFDAQGNLTIVAKTINFNKLV